VSETVIIRPQPGPQETFLRTKADIAIFGGSAGGGKTYSLLLEPLRHVNNPGFNGTIFRRESPEILNAGGLVDESSKIYPYLGAVFNKTRLLWTFPSGASVRFSHLQYEEDKHAWMGSQLCLIGWDELTRFTEDQFWYLLSRNRSLCGVKPYIRATCNPDPFSFVKRLLAPWLDRTYPNPAASGELRHFIRDNGLIHWVDATTPDAKSLTFIRSSIYDNKILLKQNPEYLANLKALPAIERARLLDGDWEAVQHGSLFQRKWFPILPTAPECLQKVRFWDLAATDSKRADYTAGVLLGKAADNSLCVLDVKQTRGTPHEIEGLIRKTAEEDGNSVAIWMEQEGGSSGKIVIDHYTRNVLQGFTFKGSPPKVSKVERANPVASFAERCSIPLLKNYWNDAFINELLAFPNPNVHDDMVDALSGAFAALNAKRIVRYV
jgi:predicted phage terminase large subunit-like protein